jgi:hypothetical protein
MWPSMKIQNGAQIQDGRFYRLKLFKFCQLAIFYKKMSQKFKIADNLIWHIFCKICISRFFDSRRMKCVDFWICYAPNAILMKIYYCQYVKTQNGG